MVSFRFHIVSITAVFLGIALGIAIGVTVINSRVVDVANRSNDRLRARVANLSDRIDEMNAEAKKLRAFAQDSSAQGIKGLLKGRKVVFVVQQDVDSDVTSAMRSAVAAAGATDFGTLKLSNKWVLNDHDADTLRGILGSNEQSVEKLRAEAMRKLSDELVAGSTADYIPQLLESGFISWAPSAEGTGLDQLSADSMRWIVVGEPEADKQTLATSVSFSEAVTRSKPKSVIVACASPGSTIISKVDDGDVPCSDAMRADRQIHSNASVIDHSGLPPTDYALIYAVRDLAQGIIGDYGTAKGSDSLLPASARAH